MAKNEPRKFYLVESSVLPEIFLKVADAKEFLQTGECATVGEAAAKAGISRSAFYKYRDAITPFHDLKQGNILTFHILLRDQPGLLSLVLSVFARCRANILTINQSIPVNGCATITISAETASMTESTQTLMDSLLASQGVLRAEVVAG